MTTDPSENGHTRRQFLGGASASLAFCATPPSSSTTTPSSVNALIYPINQSTSGPYPEQSATRYSALSGKWGVSFSGGGSRAFSAALGQMRGLTSAGVIDSIGAISCVSGGTWFGVPYTFAPASFTDDQLLGPLVQPGDLTTTALNDATSSSLGALIQNLNTDNVLCLLAKEYLALRKIKATDKLWSRMLNDTLLAPLGLGDTQTLFTLNDASLQSIRQRNPTLTANFQLPRVDRPFLIAGATQIFPTNRPRTPAKQVGTPGQAYRTFEYTPLYTGAARLIKYGPKCTKSGGQCFDFGGGYVESFAFDTPTPTSSTGGMVNVPTGGNPFLLSDVVGSSSAAIESYVDARFPNSSGGFPQFNYWSVADVGQQPPQPATVYSFGDGGILENTGVAALLRRGYRTIFAFINSSFPLNATIVQNGQTIPNPKCVDGIDGDVARLFGHIPNSDGGTAQPTQIFERSQLQVLAAGLKSAQSAGGPAVYAGLFPVISGNQFGIAPYTPQIFWIYNARNDDWYGKLPLSVLSLFNAPAPGQPNPNLANFPNYGTALQNANMGEVLSLTPLQVNLLANMWAYTVSKGFMTRGSAFGHSIA